jgi:tetratricopeptide (TPR) repeat protein
MDFLFSSPIVPWAIGLGVAYFAWTRFGPQLGALRVPGLAKEDTPEKQAEREKKAANFLAAGKIHEDAGQMQQAVDTYLMGEEFMAAAFALEKMGRLDRAADLFLKAGDYKKAAELWAGIGKADKAAPLFEERGNNLEAARLWAQAQRWEKAAALFVKSGYPLRAAEAYEKQGDLMRAAECFERHFLENVTFSTSYSGGAPPSETRNALRAGQLYERAGAPDKAREIYLRASFFKEAAAVSSAIGQHGKAAEYYLRAEDLPRAADAFEQAGEAVRAANYRGEVAFKSGRLAEAAAFFQKGQDYQRSAELFEQIGMLREAGRAYEDANSFSAAGNVYTRAGAKDRAAACYEKSGEYETAAGFYEAVGDGGKAAELYERAGLTFKSGISAARSGQTRKAIGLLQRVPAGDEHYREATERLAEMFLETGNTALAVERLQRVLDGQPVAGNVDLYYWLARAHEQGQPKTAVQIYKRIQSEDFDCKDVGARVAALETGAPMPARWVMKEEIGRGPLGSVHKGEDSLEKATVAMRVLPAAAGPHLAAAVEDVRAAAAVTHPGLVRVLGVCDAGGAKAVVTEYVKGANLAAPLKAGQKFTLAQAQGIGRAVAQTLAALHARGVAHGSVQPSNVMSAGGAMKLADLGLGRLHRALVPTGPYTAPEGRVDAPGDVFALGALLHHLVAGAPPRSRAPVTLPAPFDAILPRCLDPRPEARPRAEEVAALLGARA